MQGFKPWFVLWNTVIATVQSFKHLGAIVTDEGSVPEIRSRIAHTIATLTKLKII